MTRRKDSDGNALNKNGARRATISRDVDRNVTNDSNALLDAALGGQALERTMDFFCNHDRGYLKLRRGLDSDDIHITYTWSVGTWRGYYVYVRCEYWRLLFGLTLLEEKVLDVDNGLRKPTPDKRVG